MSQYDTCLALIDANDHCAREVARRTRGDVLKLESTAARWSDRLEQAGAVAFLGSEVDLEIVKRCIDARKHVLVAAEACRSPTTVENLVEQASGSAVLLQFGNSVASLPSRQLIWEQCLHGKLGEPGLIRVHSWGTKRFAHSSSEDGFSTVMLLEIDNALRFFSEAPQRVFAMEYSDHRGHSVHLSWTSGAMVMLDCVRQLAGNNAYASFSLIGSHGSAYADDHQNIQLLIQSQPIGWAAGEAPDPQLPMLIHFLSRACSPKPSATSADCGQEDRLTAGSLTAGSLTTWPRTIAIAEAIAQSLQTGKAVELDSLLGQR